MSRLFVACSLTASLLWAGIAHAGDVDDCVAASEGGQKLRQKGQLRDARDRFQQCTRAVCPALVQRGCTTWLNEVVALLPTVTLSAVDGQGKDLVDVTVSLDGKPLVQRLDGKAVAVDPGVHVFRFESNGQGVDERVVITEGDKARKVSVRIGEPSSGSGSGNGDPHEGAPKEKDKDKGGHSPFPFVVGGIGVATLGTGIVLYATGSADFPSECDRDTKTCANGNADSNSRASSADNRMRAGVWTMIIGSALIVGGAVWFFVEPTEPKASKSTARTPPKWLTVRPELGLGYAGVNGTF